MFCEMEDLIRLIEQELFVLFFQKKGWGFAFSFEKTKKRILADWPIPDEM